MGKVIATMPPVKTCTWSLDWLEAIWETECREEFDEYEHRLHELVFLFCPWCSRAIAFEDSDTSSGPSELTEEK